MSARTVSPTWRQWAGGPRDALITVCTYETRVGEPMDPRHSRMMRIQHVPLDDALRMLRTGATS